MDKKQNSIFTIGAQYGTGGYSYNRLQVGDTGYSIVNGSLSESEEMFNSGGNDPTAAIDGGSLSDFDRRIIVQYQKSKIWI